MFKKSILMLAVPLLILPQISSAVMLDASDLYLRPFVLDATNTSKDNYTVSYSSTEVKDGVISFDNKTASFSVRVTEKSTATGMPRLQSVNFKLYDAKSLNPLKTVLVTQTDRSGVYSFPVVPSELNQNSDYRLSADLVFTSQVEGSIPVQINNPNVLLLSLKHKEVVNNISFVENYTIVTSPSAVGGSYLFNYTTYNNFTIVVKESNANASTHIQAVTLRVVNRESNVLAYSKTITNNYASFPLQFNALGLALDKAYQSFVDVKYVTGTELKTKTYSVTEFVGMNYGQVNDPVFTENYLIVTNPALVGGSYIFSYDTYNNLTVVVKEKNATADTNISNVTLRIVDRESNALAYQQSINGDYASFALKFNTLGLDLKKAYRAYVDVKYVTGSQASTRTYLVSDLVGINYGQTINPVFTENYLIVTNPALVGGSYIFSYDTYNNLTVVVKEKNASADTNIESVTLRIVDRASNALIYKQAINGDYASFALKFNSLGLDLKKAYKAYVDVKYLTASQSSTRTYFVSDLVGINYGQSVNPNPDPSPTLTFTENSKVVTNPASSSFVFSSGNKYTITISEISSSYDTKIQSVTLKVINKDTNELSQTATITGRSASFPLILLGEKLKFNQSYKASVDVTYITGTSVVTKNYYVADLIGVDYNKVTPVNPVNPVNPVTPVTPINPQEIDNVHVMAMVGPDYINEVKPGTDYSMHINAFQKNPAVKSIMPRVSKIEILANGSVVKTCTADANSMMKCEFDYIVRYGSSVKLQAKAVHVYDLDASNYSYTKTYDLGTYNNNGSVTPGSNDPTLLNQYALIKGTGPQVYLVNKAGHRYYIPAWSVLKSWYHTAPSIIQVNDAELPQYQLKGNMIYKPGSLIKIATDPKCYAVDKNGVLRWVINERVARSIYGSTWNKNIYIVPDSLFPSYSFGSTIYSSADYSIPMLSEVVNMYNN